jgi:hypothetical protein
MDGRLLADGELVQRADGGRMRSRLTFRFKDGSLHDETTVYTQQGQFRLVSDHLVQRGPAFRQPVEMTIDAATGDVIVRYGTGTQKTSQEHFDLPADAANGMLAVVLKSLDPAGPLPTLSFVAATPEPRLVKLELSAAGTEPLDAGGSRVQATHYVAKIQLGSLTGVLAHLIDKAPPDLHFWIVTGPAPAFLRSQGPLFAGGPVWRIEVVK